jgi:tetratricopeptide (TPR) repeat protein
MSKKRVIICLIINLLLFLFSTAGKAGNITDSLKKNLFRTDNPKEKGSLYLELAKIYESDQPDSAMLYLGSARTLAIQSDDPKLLGEIYYSLGNISVIRNNLDLAMSQYNVAARFYQRAGDTSGYTRMLLLRGNILIVHDDIGSAMNCYLEATGLAEKYHYNKLLAHLYNNTGEIYQESNDRKKAMEYFTKAYNLFIRNGDSANLGNALNNIGLVYYYLGNNELAGNYASRALEVYTRAKDNFNIALCLMTLGMIESDLGHYQKAMELLNNCKSLAYTVSQVYAGPKDVWRAEILIRIGINFLRMGKYEEALKSLLEGFTMARTMKLPRMVILASENLSKTYEKLGDQREALRYYRLFAKESDSLSRVITVRAVELTEIRQQYLKKQKENELRIQFEKSGKRTMLIIYIISGIILMAIILILFLLLKLEKNRKKQSEIEKKSLDDKLEFQNREMTSNVMYINKMNEQVVQIAEKLKNLSIEEGSDNAHIIRSLIRELGQGSQGDAWKEFEIRFQNVNTVFYRNLTEKYPDLTPNELKLCAFLRLNMSTKEISSLTYQSENSIMVARTRLRQKLGISRNENLITFLSQF